MFSTDSYGEHLYSRLLLLLLFYSPTLWIFICNLFICIKHKKTALVVFKDSTLWCIQICSGWTISLEHVCVAMHTSVNETWQGMTSKKWSCTLGFSLQRCTLWESWPMCDCQKNIKKNASLLLSVFTPLMSEMGLNFFQNVS